MATNGELVPSSGITKLMVKFSLGVPRMSALGHKRTSIALRDRAHGNGMQPADTSLRTVCVISLHTSQIRRQHPL